MNVTVLGEIARNRFCTLAGGEERKEGFGPGCRMGTSWWPVFAKSVPDAEARRPDGKARGARKSGICQRRATPPAGMPRPAGGTDLARTGH